MGFNEMMAAVALFTMIAVIVGMKHWAEVARGSGKRDFTDVKDSLRGEMDDRLRGVEQRLENLETLLIEQEKEKKFNSL